MAACSIPEADALAICALRKEGVVAGGWADAGNGTWKLSAGVICEPPRRGLVVDLYASSGGKRVPRRKVNLGLWDRLGGGYERVYQLTIAPADLPTHGEDGVTWFGSHEHVGTRAVLLPALCDAPLAEALAFFCQRTTLTFSDPIEDPYEFKLR